MEFETVKLTVEGSAARIVLNRPQVLNAMSVQLGEDLRKALAIVSEDQAIKVLIVTGEGRAFCAGGEMEEILRVNRDPFLAERSIRVFLDCVEKIRTMDLPVIARINGDAIGGGALLALACDFKVAVETARFGILFVRIGLAGADAGASYLLPRMVGLTRATEMLMLGEMIDAREAHRIGMLTRVVPPDRLDEEVWEISRRIINGPTLALRMTKRALARTLDKDLATEFDFECHAQTLCIQSADAREGAMAMVEKRRPVFKGN